jgi:3-methyladenine DNA glycosylase AlkD
MKTIVDSLFDMQDLQYRSFVAKLTPSVNIENIIGVRTPQLRTYAKELRNNPIKHTFLKQLPHKYYEENNLHGMLIQNISTDINEIIQYINDFLPHIDNWATCDTLSPKIFKKHPAIVRKNIISWLNSSHTYTIRFGIVTLLQFFLDEHFLQSDLSLVAQIKSDEYYVNMAIAWYYSYALIKQYTSTLPLFESQQLNKWIHNKSIQKAIESYRIPTERKDYLRQLRIR